MVIDIHVHVRLGPESDAPLGLLDAHLASADRAGIDHLCLLGNVFRFGCHPSRHEVRAINDTILACVAHRPDRVSGMCFLNPAHGRRFLLEEIGRCVARGPLSGVKLWTAVNARDRRLDPIMEAAADLDVPVLHHAWYKTVNKVARESDPADIADLARRHPKTAIIMAHLVGDGIRGVLDIKPYPNVLVDTSGSQPVAGMVEYAVAELGAHRVVFGSDMCVRDFACQLGKVTGAKISARDRKLILHDNAARLLKLRPEDRP